MIFFSRDSQDIEIFFFDFGTVWTYLLSSFCWFRQTNNGQLRSVDAREVSAEYCFENKLSFLVRIHDHLDFH